MCSLPGDCARGTCGRGVGLGGRSPPSQGSPRGRSYNSSAQRSHPTAVASLLTLAHTHRVGRAGGEPRHHGQQPARVHKDLPAAARWSSGALPDRTGADTPRNWSSGALPGGDAAVRVGQVGRSLVLPHAAARWSSGAHPRRAGLNTQVAPTLGLLSHTPISSFQGSRGTLRSLPRHHHRRAPPGRRCSPSDLPRCCPRLPRRYSLGRATQRRTRPTTGKRSRYQAPVCGGGGRRVGGGGVD